MENIEELNTINPIHKFYEVIVQVEVETENPKNGKISIKKERETHLVDAQDPTEIQKKVIMQMAGTIYDWKIIAIKESKIMMIY